jgi:hypothetical protein
MAAWLEKLAKLAHQHFFAIASLLVLALVAVLFSDSLTHWIAGTIPFAGAKSIKGLGKNIGKAALVLGIIAALYYGVRESYLMARKKQVALLSRADSFAKYWLAVLRYSHPLIGTAVFAAVMLHGYVLWRIWAGGKFGIAIDSGLVAATVLLVVAVSGISVRYLPKLIQVRTVHRFAGILFVVSFIVHKIIAD